MLYNSQQITQNHEIGQAPGLGLILPTPSLPSVYDDPNKHVFFVGHSRTPFLCNKYDSLPKLTYYLAMAKGYLQNL